MLLPPPKATQPVKSSSRKLLDLAQAIDAHLRSIFLDPFRHHRRRPARPKMCICMNALAGAQALEPRLMLSIEPIAHGDRYQTYAGGTFVVGTERGLLANDTDPAGGALTAVATSQPEHGKLTLNHDGSFTYLPDAGFQGRDGFSYRALVGTTQSNVATVSLDVLPRSAMPKPSANQSGGGVSPLDSGTSPEDGAVLTIGPAEAKAGATLDFEVSLTHVPSGEGTQTVEFDTYDGTAYGSPPGDVPGDYQSIAAPQNDWFFDGDASTIIMVPTFNNGPRTDGTKEITMGLHGYRQAPYPTPDASNTGTIDLTPSPEDCDCSCDCGNVEPKPDEEDGTPTANTGQGKAPQDLTFHGDEEPHPIITIPGVLSAGAASADNVMMQTVIDDLSGNVIGTAPAVYYNPAGYSQGQQLQFSQQIDAAGLADGTYEYTTNVTEDYTSSGAPAVTSTYSGFFSVNNLDNSPYGSGWSLHNVDRLFVQAGGVTLMAAAATCSSFSSRSKAEAWADRRS